MAVAIPYIVVAAAVVSAAAAVRQGQAAKAAAEYNVKVNEQNSAISRQEADALARQHDREMYMRFGAIRAAQGKSGGAANEGSVLDVLGDVASQGEIERQHIVYRGELKARGYDSTARLDEFAGREAKSASYLKAGGELLGGASGGYNAYRRGLRAA